MPNSAKTILIAFFEALNTRDRTTLEGLLHEDVVLVVEDENRIIGDNDVATALMSDALTQDMEFADIEIFLSENVSRIAAEYTLTHLVEEETSTSYTTGGFFEISDEKLERIKLY